MRKYEDALWSGVAAIHSQSNGIDHVEWKRFSENLRLREKYPGINGIGVIYHMARDDVPVFLARERASRRGFRIYPPHNRQELFPITFIEPANLNSAAIGLDMAHETNRYTAARKARDTGKSQITGPITLVQDAAKTPGFLFYAPFYKGRLNQTIEDRQKDFIGMVYAPFIFKNLMEGTLEKDLRHVGIRITDGKDVLYDENHAGVTNFDPRPLFSKTTAVEAFGRTWEFEILTKKTFNSSASNERPWLILVGGLIIDSLLLILFYILARNNRQAVQFADKMTGQFQAKANRLSEIIEQAVDGLMTVDENGLIESFNPACEQIFGYTAKEAIGQNIRALIPEPYAEESEQKRSFARKAEGRQKSGETILLELSFSEISVEGRQLFSGILRDITAQVEAENEILRSNLELERFAYIASHDLQEPLRMVSSFSELLHEEYGDKLDEQGRQYVDWTLKSSKRMQALVSDLLEYSRADADESGFSEFDSGAQISAVIDNLGDVLDQTGAKITIGDMPVIFANPLRFSRLMQNLVGNATKYRATDRDPEIEITAEDRDGEWLFSVRDNGIGMRSEYLEQIFVIFKRLHNKDEYPGTGIGLSVCKKIVENFGGRIWVESEPSCGSEFFFSVAKPQKARNAA
jgi:PAS domain S-box-containing protein